MKNIEIDCVFKRVNGVHWRWLAFTQGVYQHQERRCSFSLGPVERATYPTWRSPGRGRHPDSPCYMRHGVRTMSMRTRRISTKETIRGITHKDYKNLCPMDYLSREYLSGGLYTGVSVGVLCQETPPLRPETPPEGTWDQRQRPTRRNIGPETEIPRRNMGPGNQTGSDIMQRPLRLVDRITDMCKNITLPKTSSDGSKNACHLDRLWRASPW